VTEGMGGTGQDMGWGGREGKGGSGGKGRRGATVPQFLAPPLLIWTSNFVNPGSAPGDL